MVLFEVLFAILLLAVIYLLYKNLEWRMKFERKVKEWIETEEKKIREDAALRSGRVLSGKTLEKLVPFLEKFPYDPHDIRWLGDPIDFIIFDGHSYKSPKEIVFCEVKSGNSSLNKIQKRIKNLIEKKKVKWFEFKI